MRWATVTSGLVVLVLAPPVFAATTVHRCGADGRTFSQTPCRDGNGVAVQLDDAPSHDRLTEARNVVTREAAAAARLARHRQQLERLAPRGPAVIPHRRDRRDDVVEERAGKRPREFRAIAPAASGPAP